MLMLKNKTEREAFVKDYKSWGVWKQISELNLEFYRYEFANGATLIVTEYQHYGTWKKECKTEHKLCLILPEDDMYVRNTYAYSGAVYKFYDPSDCSINMIVDYLTKNKTVV